MLFVWAAGVRAADVAVFPVEGTNLSEGEVDAIGQLIASAYAVRSGRAVLGPRDMAESLARTASERDSAAQAGLNEYIHIEAVRLTTRIALYVRLHNRHGSKLYEVRETALSLDDMEVVSERLADTLVRRTPIENTATIDNVTGRETRGRNRLFVEKIFGARFAVVAPFARHMKTQPSLVAQFDARLEQRDYFLEAALGFWLPSDPGSGEGLAALLAHLGGSYYFTHTSVSPYVGVGVSPRVFLGSYTGAGLAVGGHVGLMFLRASSTRLYAEIQIDQNLIKARSRSEEVYSPTTRTYVASPEQTVLPTELSFAAGIGF